MELQYLTGTESNGVPPVSGKVACCGALWKWHRGIWNLTSSRDSLVKQITLLYPQHPCMGHSATGLLDVFIGESGCWNAFCFC
jgi:hypothetical protein